MTKIRTRPARHIHTRAALARNSRTEPAQDRPDRGSVTVLMIGVMVAALLLAMMLSALGRATHAHAHAQGVADLAALAAARELVHTGAAACPVAERVAHGHTAHLAHCSVEGLMVQVEVVVRTEPLPGWTTSARAGARAGPVGLDSPG